jgi:hypothetical protein
VSAWLSEDKGEVRISDSTSAAIIRKLAHATPGTNIPNVTERNVSETQKEYETQGGKRLD